MNLSQTQLYVNLPGNHTKASMLKRVVSMLLMLILVSDLFGQIDGGTYQWAKNFGAEGSFLYQSGTKVAVDAQKNVYMTGFIQGAVSLGSNQFFTNQGSQDVLVAKFNPEGDVLWADSFGGDGLDYGYGISPATDGGVYLTGFFAGTVSVGGNSYTSYSWRDYFIMKYDVNGQVLWFHHGGGSFAEGMDIEVDSEGSVLLAAYFYDLLKFDNSDTTLTSAGESDAVVVKYSSVGDLLWIQQAGGVMTDAAMGIATDAMGNVYVAGFFYGSVLFGSTTLVSVSEWESDGYIWKLDSNGSHQWAIAVGGESSETLYDIAATPDGTTYTTGAFASGSFMFGPDFIENVGDGFFDVCLFKTSSDGIALWGRCGGGPDSDYGRDVSIDQWGNPLICGNFQGEAYFGTHALISIGNDDAFILKYDSWGGDMWSLTGSGASSECSESVVAGPENSYYTTGYFYDQMNFGNFVLNSISDQDIFLTKLTEPWTVGTNESRGDVKISVVPNPASTSIKVNTFNRGFVTHDAIRIITNDGCVVLNTQYQDNLDIDVAHLASGFYSIQLLNMGEVVSTTKLVITH